MKTRVCIRFFKKGISPITIMKHGTAITKEEKRILKNKDGLLGIEAMKIAHDIFPIMENFATGIVGDMYGKDPDRDYSVVSKRCILTDKDASFDSIDIVLMVKAEIDTDTIKRLIAVPLPIGKPGATSVYFDSYFNRDGKTEIVDFMLDTGNLIYVGFSPKPKEENDGKDRENSIS